MRLHTTVWTVVLTCALAAAAPPALAQDGGSKPDEKAMMEAMAKAAAPGPEHKQLEAMVGSWTTETKTWMAPGQPPMVSSGAAENTSILGGRYIQQEYKGDFMNMPFVGTGLTGYDKTLKRYVATWADNMSTGILRLTGTYDEATKTYTYDGTYPDPTAGKELPTRMAIRIVSANQHVMEWYDPTPDGKWQKVMEITYTRK
jgi:hypothetical protein